MFHITESPSSLQSAPKVLLSQRMLLQESAECVFSPTTGLNCVHTRRTVSTQLAAFTLIEIVLVLSLVAIIAAAAVPAINGIREEAVAREPLTALSQLAKETRLRAMQDKRPYQIAFTQHAFTATRYLSPYLQAAELANFLQNPSTSSSESPVFARDFEPPDPDYAASNHETQTQSVTLFTDWTKSYSLPEGTQYRVQFWHEAAPMEISGDFVKLWVFQPTGIVVPLTVTLTHQNNTFSASFNPLTADIDRLQHQ